MTALTSSILFACTWNAVRSPMAEAITKQLVGTRAFVDSVGVRKADVDPFVLAVLGEIGIDKSAHQSKTFDELEDSSFDLVVSLSPEAQHKAIEMTRWSHCEVEFWHTLDPSIIEGSREIRLQTYREVRDQLKKRLIERFSLAPPPVV